MRSQHCLGREQQRTDLEGVGEKRKEEEEKSVSTKGCSPSLLWFLGGGKGGEEMLG